MQTTTRINTPILTEIAQPSSSLTLTDLSNVNHPVNIKALSGKRDGMACLIDEKLYMATGSNPSSLWTQINLAPANFSSPDKQVIVKQASDLSGVLDSTKEYFIDGVIDMGTQQIEVPVNGLSLRGYSMDNSQLVSSEDNYTMFVSPSGGSGNLLGQDYSIKVSGAGSKVYELYDATGFNAFEFTRVNYNDCTSLGDLYDYRQGLEAGTGRFGGSPSLTLHGLWRGGYRITTSIVRGLAGTMTEPLFKAGALFQMDSRFLTDINVDLPTLAALCDFSPINFPNPSTVQVKGALITRDGNSDSEDTNIFSNLSESNLACDWDNNVGLSNTFIGGSINNTSELVTTIVTQGDAVDLNGTFLASDLQHFDSPNNGELRHLGTSPVDYIVHWDFIIDGKNNDNYEIFLIKLDEAGAPTVILKQVRTVNNLQGGRDVGIWSGQAAVTLRKNERLLWQIANLLDNDNCTLEVDSSWSVRER